MMCSPEACLWSKITTIYIFLVDGEPKVATNVLFDRANHHIFAELTSLEVNSLVFRL